ncbi:MAG: DUF2754 domain-containing protein [Enterobacteriaceae bacterium]
MKLTEKIRRDWHYYAFALGLIFILNGVVGLLGFETQGWRSYAVGLVTWVISFWIAGFIIRRRPARKREPEVVTRSPAKRSARKMPG